MRLALLTADHVAQHWGCRKAVPQSATARVTLQGTVSSDANIARDRALRQTAAFFRDLSGTLK
jgi:hypothetical protein